MTKIENAGITARLPPELATAYGTALARWHEERGSERLWSRDASLWTGGDEGRWLGWLEPGAGCDLGQLALFSSDVSARGIRTVVLLGMGGSSLGAELIVRAVRRPDAPELCVLDTTDPDEIRAVEDGLDLARTLFIVASKSGTTIESVSLEEYFWRRLADQAEAERARAFIAITDPGTPLDTRARERGYRVFHGVPEIGGRFSALSPFGLVPAAAVLGHLEPVLRSARDAAAGSAPAVAAVSAPGVVLGVLLATLHDAGRGQLTVFPSPEVELLGPWLEQLLAESTGKHDQGILPIAGEERLPLDAYRGARALVEWAGAHDTRGGQRGDEREVAAVPTLVLPPVAAEDIGGEIFRWELATAVAGALIGLHPFDQPDVETAKVVARRLAAAAHQGALEPRGEELHAAAEWRWFASTTRDPSIRRGASPIEIVRAHLDTLAGGDFFALLAYLPRGGAVEPAVQRIRNTIAARRGVATTLGFGPRYLHSTGQYMKGGPNRGVYLFVTRRVADDLSIPEQDLGFGALQRAQALGDIEVLAERGRRVLHVELGDEIEPALERLVALFDQVA